MDTRTKIISLDEALRLRSEGRRWALAAGAFDVLQAAHVRFLREIRSDGALLLVAVYDDASVGKPVLPEQARAQLVAALAAVDHVILWPGPKLDSLIEQLQPERVGYAGRNERNIIEEVLRRNQ